MATFQEAYNQKALESLTAAISTITDEVNELSKYCRTNYAGFLKIVKKHDVCFIWRHTNGQQALCYLVLSELDGPTEDWGWEKLLFLKRFVFGVWERH